MPPEHHAEQVFRIEKDCDGHKKALQDVECVPLILDKPTLARWVTILLRLVRYRNEAMLCFRSSQVRHPANDFSHRFLTRRESESDDAQCSNEIAQTIFIWISNDQSLRIILVA